jgi:cytochrome c oxidase cbb3-type subunit 3
LKLKSRFPLLMTFCAFQAGAVFAQAPANRAGDGANFRGPQVDQAALQRGKDAFGSQCGFCHGQDARGTGAGPDLARSLLILSDENGTELGEFLQLGRPQSGMPAFANLSRAQVADLAVFLHDRVQAARARSVSQAVVGDPAMGRAYFEGAGRCASCHSESGNLKGIGTRYDPLTLTDKMVNPRSGGGRGATADRYPRNVRVRQPDGKTVSGTLLYINEFAVTLRDSQGQRMSFRLEGRREGDVPQVEIIDPLQAHQDLLTKLADSDLHNLTAYLVTFK